jgi:hypothetical protein
MYYQQEVNLISSISSIACFRIEKRKTWIVVVECPLQLFGCTWIIQWVKMGQKSCQNSTSITLHDCRTHPIRQTWAGATFASSGCWKEYWRIEDFIRMMKLKRRLRWPGMTSHSMRSRASSAIRWTELDGSLRTGESTLLNKGGSVYLCLLSNEIGTGAGDFLYPLYSDAISEIDTNLLDNVLIDEIGLLIEDTGSQFCFSIFWRINCGEGPPRAVSSFVRPRIVIQQFSPTISKYLRWRIHSLHIYPSTRCSSRRSDVNSFDSHSHHRRHEGTLGIRPRRRRGSRPFKHL